MDCRVTALTRRPGNDTAVVVRDASCLGSALGAGYTLRQKYELMPSMLLNEFCTDVRLL
jgi:hypothetical protein